MSPVARVFSYGTLALIAVLCCALGMVAHLAHNVVPWGLLHPMRPNPAIAQAFEESFEQAMLDVRDSTYALQTDDSTAIAVRRLTPRSGIRATVVIVHGIASIKESGLPAAAWCLRQGFEVLLMDQRGHGASSGSTCSYGYFERWDLAAVIADASVPLDRPLILWGNSMGAATVLLAAEHAVEHNQREPSLVIAESGYASAPDVMKDFLRQKFGWDVPFLASMTIRHCSEVLGIDANDILPERAVGRYRGPVLVLHGTHDDRVPFAHAERLADAMERSPAPLRTMVPIPGAGHVGLRDADPERYDESLRSAFAGIGL